MRLLEAARAAGVKRFLQVSTDEVYGSLGPTGLHRDDAARAEQPVLGQQGRAPITWCMAFHHTHGMATVITRCSNNYGPYQFPEKLIPLMILNAFDDQPLPVYGDGMYVRDWIHVEDHCEAIDAVLPRGGRRGLQRRRPATSGRTWTSSARSCGSRAGTKRSSAMSPIARGTTAATR